MLLSVLLTLSMLPGPQQMLREDPNRAGVNTHIYEFIDETVTPAPKGYKPVYLSHYARHGSRNDFSPNGYDYVMEVLKQAEREGILTQEGKELLDEARQVIAAWDGRPGHLTRRGAWEHQEQARRILKAYGDVFKKGNKKVRVEVSIVPRSILSGTAFTNELSSSVKGLSYTFDSGERIQRYMDNKADPVHKKAADKMLDIFKKKNEPDGNAIYERLFTDPERGKKLSISSSRFNKYIFALARTAQASDLDINIFRHLSEETVYFWWEYYLRDLYIKHGNSVEFGQVRMPRAEPMVRDILEKADDALNNGTVCADLKFGHDYPSMAAAGYFGLEEVGARLSFDEIPEKWANPRNIPLGTNLQLVFYRNGKGNVLVKFVYNGIERHLEGLQPVESVFYDWEQVKARFLRDPNAFADQVEWKDGGNGLQYAVTQAPAFGAMQTVSVIRFKADEHRLDVVDAPAENSDSTSALAQKAGALAAINGSYFNMKTLVPTTFVKDSNKVKGMTTPDELFRVDGMFVYDGKWMRILRSAPEKCEKYARGYDEALAAGPILLSDGREIICNWPSNDTFYTRRHPRSVIGTDDNGYIYLMVIDGRFKEGIGATIEETAKLARMVGMTEALNLDGGGSATLWIEGPGVINHPYDNKKYDGYGQRVVPNVVVVK
ncbi:MAG: phosphodiester glycosidase family protein [Bacteroidales bacterium]|nr:phosphodiester glycosidase family protein [Bacteroidales bacterium]